MKEIKKVVLAYSGGLDTSIIIPWLKENYNNCEVIAVSADVGQGTELDGLEEKALKTGASKLYIEDLKKEFVEDYIFPTLKAGAVYERDYLLGTSFARPLIAKRLVEIAKAEGADAICHGCTGKGNDQVRFELAIKAFAPDMQIIAPWRIWSIKSREEEIEYAEKHNIPLKINRETNYSKDKNLWHLSHEGLDLEDPANEPQYNKPGFLEIGKSPEQAPDKPTYITISFEKGVPVAVDGEKLDGVTMIEKLNKIGGENGVGLADIVENRLVGMKSRGVYENPAGAILYRAHEVLETLTLDRDTMHYKEQVALRYAELVYFGQWFTPLREALAAFVDKTQERVTGDVKLKLYKGNIINAGTTSPYSLYSEAFATFDKDDVYDQKDSAGFINLFGLPIKVKSILDAERGKGMKLWAGRFSKEADKKTNDFNSSIKTDSRMFNEDIDGSIAHASMLAAKGIISDEDCEKILAGLSDIRDDIISGELTIDPDAEDIHTFIEGELTSRIGDAGKRLHTGRSRNDQVAVDIRLYLRKDVQSVTKLINGLIAALDGKAKEYTHCIMPGYTHLQRAQPITFSAHIGAYIEMLRRDLGRFEDAAERMNLSPLGSGALAGTTYPIDRAMTTEALGFDGYMPNTLDGVSDRDFCLELLGACSILMVHISRLCEEIIMWCSWEFKFAELDDAFSTGSSIMPQKKNPDLAELARGKAGRVIGDLCGLLTTMKGLPLAYNKDMQEDKDAIFDGMDTVKMCLTALTPMIATMKMIPENMRKAAAGGFINATDCADFLVSKGLPFRDAYKATGELVALCIKNGTTLEELPIDEYKSICPLFDEGVYDAINLENCVTRRGM